MAKRGSFTIGEIMGIEVTLNPLLILIIVICLIFDSISLLAALYFSIAAHEMAHCITARALNIRVDRLELLPFGCAAKIEEALELKPMCEAAIAIMGPFVNLFLAMCAVFIQYCFAPHLDVVRFVQINVLLGGLNLVPAIPLDGGRFLRGLIASRYGVKKATSVVSVVSFIVAVIALTAGVIFIIQGMVVPNLFFISLLIIFYALRGRRGNDYMQLRSATNNSDIIKRRGKLKAENIAVMKGYAIGRLIDSLVPGKYHIITIIDHRYHRAGVISEGDLMDGLVEFGASAPVEMLLRNTKGYS